MNKEIENFNNNDEGGKKPSIWEAMTKKRIKDLSSTNIRIKEMLDANTRQQIEDFAKKLDNKNNQ